MSLVDLRHHAEQARPRRQQRVGDRHVGGQRQRRVLLLGRRPRAVAQLEAVVGLQIDLLLGERHTGARFAPSSPASIRADSSAKPGGRSPALTLSYASLARLRTTARSAPSRLTAAVLVDAHHEDHRWPVDVRQQAGRTLRQRRPGTTENAGRAGRRSRPGSTPRRRAGRPAARTTRRRRSRSAARCRCRPSRSRTPGRGRSRRPGRSSRTRSRCGRRARLPDPSGRPTARWAASSTSGGKPSGISNSDRIRSSPAAIAAVACSSSRISGSARRAPMNIPFSAS